MGKRDTQQRPASPTSKTESDAGAKTVGASRTRDAVVSGDALPWADLAAAVDRGAASGLPTDEQLEEEHEPTARASACEVTGVVLLDDEVFGKTSRAHGHLLATSFSCACTIVFVQSADGRSKLWLPCVSSSARAVGKGSIGLELQTKEDDQRVGLLLHFFEAELRDDAMALLAAMSPG